MGLLKKAQNTLYPFENEQEEGEEQHSDGIML
jgi:hypothetical protein